MKWFLGFLGFATLAILIILAFKLAKPEEEPTPVKRVMEEINYPVYENGKG